VSEYQELTNSIPLMNKGSGEQCEEAIAKNKRISQKTSWFI